MSSNINFANAPSSFAPQEISTPQQARTRKDAGSLSRAGLQSGILASTRIEPLSNKDPQQQRQLKSHRDLKRPHYERGLDSGIVDSARIAPLDSSAPSNPTWTETVTGAGSAAGDAVRSAAATVTGLWK